MTHIHRSVGKQQRRAFGTMARHDGCTGLAETERKMEPKAKKPEPHPLEKGLRIKQTQRFHCPGSSRWDAPVQVTSHFRFALLTFNLFKAIYHNTPAVAHGADGRRVNREGASAQCVRSVSCPCPATDDRFQPTKHSTSTGHNSPYRPKQNLC